MKFSTIILPIMAAFATAAPAPSKFGGKNNVLADFSLVNNLAFSNLDLAYLNKISSLDILVLQSLNVNNNLDILAFAQVFQSSVFDLNALLQLQQLQTLIQLQQFGAIGASIDLSLLVLQQLNFGLIQQVGLVDLGQFVDVALLPQISAIVSGQAQLSGNGQVVSNNTKQSDKGEENKPQKLRF